MFQKSFLRFDNGHRRRFLFPAFKLAVFFLGLFPTGSFQTVAAVDRMVDNFDPNRAAPASSVEAVRLGRAALQMPLVEDEHDAIIVHASTNAVLNTLKS